MDFERSNKDSITFVKYVKSGTSEFFRTSQEQLYRQKIDEQGQYSVNVSGDWRVFFDFINGHAYVVNYDDYH